MLPIPLSLLQEILEALIKHQNGEELSDRDLWILEEYGDEESDEFE